MESLSSVADKIKRFARAGFTGSSDSLRQKPVEIAKSLRQEAHSELVKLMERQEKVEHLLAFKLGKRRPFHEVRIQMKGIINVVGFLLFGENDFQQSCGVLHGAGINTGIHSRLMFEKVVGQKNDLVAEFATSREHPLSLERLMYSAHINKFSSATIAFGTECNDFTISPSSMQEKCLNGFIPSGPPLFSQNHGCAAGIVLKGSKIAASLAELVSGIGMQRDGTGQSSCLTTFGQVSYQIFEQVKVNLSGVWQKPASGFIKLGTLTIPLSNLKQQTGSSVRAKASHATAVTETADGVLANSATGSIAIMLDSEVDGGNKLGFWLEVQKSSLGSLKWGVSLSDTPSGELGWGLKLRGMGKGQLNLQMEGFLLFCLGRNFVLQPGLVYVMEGRTRTPALICQSSWSL
ncbi:hypothetical protein OPV22_030533 [Ensete ventricosum]|uniref:Uncharacterized protein n=1 Tax=Ensete ventricosum TaxID=4639 RepID=A0AAV8Q6C5_ENSVE|nr:hypothetical protein OPV22_030533 [Ensete ventricosum]